MLIYVMRHGQALPVGGAIGSDAERPLSSEGRRAIDSVVKELKRREVRISRIWASPLVRTMETARMISEGLGIRELASTPLLAPQGSVPSIDKLLRNTQGDVLFVGHQPDMGYLVCQLTSEHPFAVSFSPGSIAALQWRNDGRQASLLWNFTPPHDQ